MEITLTLTNEQLESALLPKAHGNNLPATVAITLTPEQVAQAIAAIDQNMISQRIEGQVAKMVSDRIALQFRDRISQILESPDFNQKVQEHVLKLVDTMSQVTFRKM